jgi:intracellular septation protein A
VPKLIAAGRWALSEFGPLIVFWALALTLGVKPAIAGSILVILGDAAWRWRRGLAFTRLYLLVSALTLVFGAVDLVATSPFMLKYEAVVTNVATGFALLAGAMGRKPIIQEVAEQRGETIPATAETWAFFRLFTLLWRPISSSRPPSTSGRSQPCRCSRRWLSAPPSARSASP